MKMWTTKQQDTNSVKSMYGCASWMNVQQHVNNGVLRVMRL